MSITVTLEVTDPRLIAGVEYARDMKNASMPAPAEGEDAPAPLTSEEYILFVAGSAVESYAEQAERAAKLAAAGL